MLLPVTGPTATYRCMGCHTRIEHPILLGVHWWHSINLRLPCPTKHVISDLCNGRAMSHQRIWETGEPT